MSVFGPNQVEELIVGSAVAAETTLPTFKASASDTEIKILSADGSAPASGEDFKVFQKTAGDAAKGLDIEFSDVIKADKVKKVTLAEYTAEVQKQVTVTVDTAVANTTYIVECRIYNDGGTLSPENFAIVSGYYSTGATAPSVTVIRDGLIASLNSNLVRRGDSELVVATSSTDAITITGKAQTAVPGKIIGKQIEFDVNTKSFDETALIAENSGAISHEIDNENVAGKGTGKYAVNLEWFTKGYKYEVYRQTGYPADFGERTPYYTSQGTTYNVIHIKYFDDRDNPSVEKQNKVLTILVEFTNAASNAATNAVLADLRTILGTAVVPADLATA